MNQFDWIFPLGLRPFAMRRDQERVKFQLGCRFYVDTSAVSWDAAQELSRQMTLEQYLKIVSGDFVSPAEYAWLCEYYTGQRTVDPSWEFQAAILHAWRALRWLLSTFRIWFYRPWVPVEESHVERD